MIFNPQFKFILSILITAFLFAGCKNTITPPPLIVNPVTGIQAYSLNNSITVTFYGFNREDGFQGYNIYISRNSISSINPISPVLNTYNSTPTLPNGTIGCNPYASQKNYITVYQDSFNQPISNNYQYNVVVAAMVLIGSTYYYSNPSESIRTTVAISSNDTLNSGLTNSIIFKNNGTYSNTISGGDLVFGMNSGQPTITVSADSIQDIGYLPSINQFIQIPMMGYLANVSIPAILNHLYIIKQPSSTFIEIYITSITILSSTSAELQFTYSFF